MIQFKSVNFLQLKNVSFSIKRKSIHSIVGRNNSGKGCIASLLCSESAPESGDILELPENVEWLSFEKQQEFYEQQLKNDETDITDQFDFGETISEMISVPAGQEEIYQKWIKRFNLTECLNRGYRLLSSGESRKALLLKSFFKQPQLLILDEPFDGLDQNSCEEIIEFASFVSTNYCTVLFLLNRLQDIPNTTECITVIHSGETLFSGTAKELELQQDIKKLLSFDPNKSISFPPPPKQMEVSNESQIIRLTQGFIKYSGKTQFQNLNWQLDTGQHCLIKGPNGAGKSSLLNLITGDHPQCYSNDLKVFGIQRGKGESIWDIKKHIGIVSPALHRDYRAPGNAITAVVSGLFDSIGLYRATSGFETQLAKKWLEVFELGHLANQPFRRLSFGEQRLVLIARGMIKQPRLLILDEPTQGLDDINRHRVLSVMKLLALQNKTTLLFVSHREDEHIDTFKHQLVFNPVADQDCLYQITSNSL